MFGVLRPSMDSVPTHSKTLYHLSYCNLCAALSASGAGVWNRFFLINDVVTMDWLFTEQETSSQHGFFCNNCLKWGVIGKKNRITPHQSFLAAISSYMCGIKINDNALDEPSLKHKSLAIVYRPIMKKAKKVLKKHILLDQLSAYLALDHENEQANISDLNTACKPTEQCYELVALEIGKTLSTLPEETIGLIGQYLGQCTYFLDAIKDMDEDIEKNQYNVLNLISNDESISNRKPYAVGRCLEFLKPKRIFLTQKLRSLPYHRPTEIVREKLDGLFMGIERQLLALIKPLNDGALMNCLSSFSNGRCSNWINLGGDDNRDCLDQSKVFDDCFKENPLCGDALKDNPICKEMCKSGAGGGGG